MKPDDWHQTSWTLLLCLNKVKRDFKIYIYSLNLIRDCQCLLVPMRLICELKLPQFDLPLLQTHSLAFGIPLSLSSPANNTRIIISHYFSGLLYTWQPNNTFKAPCTLRCIPDNLGLVWSLVVNQNSFQVTRKRRFTKEEPFCLLCHNVVTHTGEAG